MHGRRTSFIKKSTKSTDESITCPDKNRLRYNQWKNLNSLPDGLITESVLGTYSLEDMINLKILNVDPENRDVRLNGKLPLTKSIYDPALGPGANGAGKNCTTCCKNDCDGHFGLIEFKSIGKEQRNFRVCNPLFMRIIYSTVFCVCHKCGTPLLNEPNLRRLGFMGMGGVVRLKAIENYLKVSSNQKTGSTPGESIPALTCEKDQSKNPILGPVKNAVETGQITIPQGAKNGVLDGDAIFRIFSKITDEGARLLGYNPPVSHPKNLILGGLLVIPLRSRPSMMLIEENQHFISKMYSEVMNVLVKDQSNSEGFAVPIYRKIANMIKSSVSPSSNIGKATDNLKKIIQGKDAIFRDGGQTSRGKLVGRSVGGPAGPGIKFGEIFIPKRWAEGTSAPMAIPVKVTQFNMNYIESLVKQKKITFFVSCGTQDRIKMSEKIRIQPGDTVYRWLHDGDIILAGRQPTLSKGSIMAFHIDITLKNTIGLNLCNTPSFNADFDGDELNAYVITDLNARAEASVFMGPAKIVTNANGSSVAGLVMNSTLGAYELSGKNAHVTKALIKENAQRMNHSSQLGTLSRRLNQRGILNTSGQAYLSMLFPENFFYHNGEVLIINGVLIRGRLKKGDVGPSANGIIKHLLRRYGISAVTNFLTDAPEMINDWLNLIRGASIGYGDLLAPGRDKNGAYIDRNEIEIQKKLNNLIEEVDYLTSVPSSGIRKHQQNIQILGKQNLVEDFGGQLLRETLTEDNNFSPPIKSGSKGSSNNLAQITGIIGQQNVNNGPLKQPLDYERISPFYSNGDPSPDASGFISSNFFKGLNYVQAYYLYAAGREGVISTAVQTQIAGSMTHNLMRLAENIKIYSDGSVRDTRGDEDDGIILCQSYNGGYDPAFSFPLKNSIWDNYKSVFDISTLVTELNIEEGWFYEEINIGNDVVGEDLFKVEEVKEEESFTEIKFEVEDLPEGIFYPYLTKYEIARIVGYRAEQLSEGSELYIPMEELARYPDRPLDGSRIDSGGRNFDQTDYIWIAQKELLAGKLENIFAIRQASPKPIKIYATLKNISMNADYLSC